jgi:hypothetical protein
LGCLADQIAVPNSKLASKDGFDFLRATTNPAPKAPLSDSYLAIVSAKHAAALSIHSQLALPAMHDRINLDNLFPR